MSQKTIENKLKIHNTENWHISLTRNTHICILFDNIMALGTCFHLSIKRQWVVTLVTRPLLVTTIRPRKGCYMTNPNQFNV